MHRGLQLLRSRACLHHPISFRQDTGLGQRGKASHASATPEMVSSVSQDPENSAPISRLLNFRDLSTAAPNLLRPGTVSTAHGVAGFTNATTSF
jgi:hypothetical protein